MRSSRPTAVGTTPNLLKPEHAGRAEAFAASWSDLMEPIASECDMLTKANRV
jgi:hypothetical protein